MNLERNIVGIVDAGGRGATLHRVYEKSPHVDGLVVFPGNDMIKKMAVKPTEVFTGDKTTDAEQIVETFLKEGVTLADVAQDNAVEVGVADRLREAGIPTVGPFREAGKIEWSKSYARRLGEKAEIRQPGYSVHTSIVSGEEYLDSRGEGGFAIKADGLAEGKGVKIARDRQEAKKLIRELKEQFPKAAETFLIEELVNGEEFSTFFVSDGENVKIVGHAQDHKRERDNDEGENTGGMGCSSPPLLMTEGIERDVLEDTEKIVRILASEGNPYKGVGYYGGMYDKMLNIANNIEFNSRWGDPEVQVVAPGLTTDMYELAVAIVEKHLAQFEVTSDTLARVSVAGASRGYPRSYEAVKGKEIFGLEDIIGMKGVELYGAGIKIDENGKYRANGGRLFYIVGEGKNVIEAREKAYCAMAKVHVDGNNLIYRTDIGWRDVQRLREEGY